jgi:hypothetical protein
MFKEKLQVLIRSAWESGQAAGRARLSPPDSINSSSQKLLTFLLQLFLFIYYAKMSKVDSKSNKRKGS